MKILKFSNDEIFTKDLSKVKNKIDQKRGKGFHYNRICVCKSLNAEEYALVKLNIFDRFVNSLFNPFSLESLKGRDVRYLSSKEFKNEFIQIEARKAAKVKLIHTGPNGSSYDKNKLHKIIDDASIEQIPYLVKGAGITILRRLLANTENLETSHLEKLKVAIQLLPESDLLKYVNDNKDWLLHNSDSKYFNWLLFDQFDGQRLDILLTHKDELSLSSKVVGEIEGILRLKEDLYQAKKDLPQLIFD